METCSRCVRFGWYMTPTSARGPRREPRHGFGQSLNPGHYVRFQILVENTNHDTPALPSLSISLILNWSRSVRSFSRTATLFVRFLCAFSPSRRNGARSAPPANEASRGGDNPLFNVAWLGKDSSIRCRWQRGHLLVPFNYLATLGLTHILGTILVLKNTGNFCMCPERP